MGSVTVQIMRLLLFALSVDPVAFGDGVFDLDRSVSVVLSHLGNKLGLAFNLDQCWFASIFGGDDEVAGLHFAQVVERDGGFG